MASSNKLTAISVDRESDAEKFRLLVENAVDYGIFMLDPEGRIATWNVGAERIKGYSAAEIIGKHFSVFYPPEAITARWPEQELELATAQGRFEDEGWRLRKDGSKFWANVIITALKDDSGKLIGFAKITRDLTSRKNVERLEEEGRHIYHFLATLAHELRNPLAPIVNAVRVMKDDPSPGIAVWARDLIERQALHLTRLVEDLLDLQRVITGKIQVRKETVNLCDATRDAVEETRALFAQREHTLSVNIPDKPLFVDGDKVRLVQVIGNLLTNAAKYTASGGAVSLALIAREGSVEITVRDNGEGIVPHMLPRIFEPFVQVDTRLERTEGGLGIGLSLVKELILQHGGTVAANSAGLGKGSEFKITLPLLDHPRALHEVAAMEHPVEAGNKLRRILIVDDSEDASESLAMLLRHYKHIVQTCSDAREAVQTLRDFRPDIVLLDIGMPGINGYEIARAIRQLDSHADVVLVATTGYGRPEDKALARAAGFDHHLVKPVDFEELLRLLG